MSESTEQSRLAFRAFARIDLGLDASYDTESGKYEDGACFYDSETQYSWQVWQARDDEINALREENARLRNADKYWEGLPRALMMWLDLNDRPTATSLKEHCSRMSIELPESITSESEFKHVNHVASKGTRAVWIFKAFIHEAAKAAKEGDKL